MKSILLGYIFLCLTLNATAQKVIPGSPKLSPLTRVLLKNIGDGQLRATDKPAGNIYREINGKTYLTGMIKVADQQAASVAFTDLGVLVNTKAGDIWTVQVPYDKISLFVKAPGVSYIQLDEPLRPSLQMARKTTRVDSVHMGAGLPGPVTGKDVVVGVIDFGFDYNHPSFYDTLGVTYRVKKVWELNTTGTPPAGYTYGHELTGTASIVAQGTDNTIQTHGTGVAGISSGSGYGTLNGKLRGVAYDADMIFVGVRRDSIGDQWRQSSFSDFADGVSYIFNYANSVGKPAVTNISWGSQSGPHDGTSLFSQACDNLSGPGKIIVMSAGNEGQERIHIRKTFSASDTTLSTFVTFSSDTLKRTWIDIWGDTAKTFCAQVTLYRNGIAGNTTGYICIDDQLHSTYLMGENGIDTCYVDFITSSSEFNDKPRLTIDLYNKAVDSIHVSVKASDSYVDMWNEYYYYGYKYGYSSAFESLNVPGAVNGNTASTVSDMGSAKSVLLIGAYASKVDFTDINNNDWTYSSYVAAGNLVPFSSRGPMADGRIKPDITAPGLTIATAISSFDTRYTPTGLNSTQVVSSTNFGGDTYYYAEFSGTSASSPMAAGIVALMLQVNPNLTPAQVHDIVAQTALKDVFTGVIPTAGNNNWGHGKINALAAIKAALQANNVYDIQGRKLDCALFPNPATGTFSMFYTGEKAESLNVEVFDLTGRVLLSESWNVDRGDNVRTFSLSGFAPGIYTVKVRSAEGSTGMKLQVR